MSQPEPTTGAPPPRVHHRDDPTTLLNLDAEPVLPGPPTPPKPTVRRFFFGDDGLRAGWSFLLFMILFSTLSFIVVSALQHLHVLHLPDPKAPLKPLTARAAAAEKFTEFVLAAIPAWFMSFVERRPFSRYGLPIRRLLPDFAQGLAWGFVCLSVLIGALALLHGLHFDGLLLHGPAALTYAAKWGLVFFLTGLGEEFLFRGYLVYTVSRGAAGIARAMDVRNRHTHLIGFLASALLFSVLFFMVAHLGNGGETGPGIVGVGLAGVVLAFSLYRTGSLWWGIGFHTTWDWAQSYFYGVADSGLAVQGHLLATHPVGSRLLSGGTVGPEGSWLVIPTLLLAGLIIHLTLPMRRYPLTPDQTPPPLPDHPLSDYPYPAGHPQMLPDQLG